MQKFTQKYAVVYLASPLSDGYEFPMSEWPLHVTLADVFAIDGDSKKLLPDFVAKFSLHLPIKTKVVGDEWFGDDKSVHVKLLDKTLAFQALHEEVLTVLARHNVKPNNPEYARAGYRPHSTVQKNSRFNMGNSITIDSLSLIDMFPGGDATRRRVLGTIRFRNSYI